MTEPSPTVGRTVHYRSYGTPGGEFEPECRAAVVTAVDDEPGVDGMTPWRVSLAVLNPTGLFFDRRIPEDPSASHGGTWHWPERS